MKSKKIISGLLALSFVFGGTALPNTVVNNSVSASASVEEIAEEAEVLTYGDYKYKLLDDGTAEIVEYTGDCTEIEENGTEEIEIPSELNGAIVTSIGYHAFFCHMELGSITLPKDLKNIGDGAFKDCNGLSSIVIPDGVECIGDDAFRSCRVLSSVTFSKNLKYIGKEAFRYCSCLHDIVIPDGVEYIGERAFAKFDSSSDNDIGYYLHYSVTIPKSVTFIGDNAFNNFSIASYAFKPAKDYIINCYKDSAAHNYALVNGNNFNVIDAGDSKTKYPELIKEEYSPKFHKFRLNWTAVEGAEQYGIAVRLAGKWKVQAYVDADTTKYVTPKLTSGQNYQTVICAKVNGKWDTSVLNNRAFPLVVR
ncbi:leucine-rich repeat domain-containing protein [Ruminococcus albus]|uniref:Leucine rich repeat-containing protein n=1 Tax=Ruminococcus albus (strain ATCC 27210 / DSM 20455 / JCM 14654 / NCDO 2250 / 7) TaxID=697329 RepID=E6UD72_RUMA7|nr:leucine-rich repeat domain-containing protein [Ruminococcus albus]ADU21677.1 hypothetical protein Rumal_1157 [Ruminococcus albus 7 = DSM 20455]